MHRLIPLDAANEWQDALSGVNHAFAHTHDYCYAMYLTTGQKTYLYCYDNDGYRIACPIIERSFQGYTDIAKPFGFSGFIGNAPCPDFHKYWNEFVRSRGYVSGYLSINPFFDGSELFDQVDMRLAGRVQMLDLTLSLEEIRAGMTRARRRQIKKVESLIDSMIVDKKELQSFLQNYYPRFLDRKSAPYYYYFTKETLVYLLHCQHVIVAGIREFGAYVAFIMFGYSPHCADGLIHIATPSGGKYTALLYWHGIKALKAKGIPFINFGGGEGGIYDFKRRFGCKDLPYYTIRQVYREDVYADLCRQTNSSHTIKDGYFPAYRN